ncbi:glycerate kinase [Piscicoccus intestinalis]|uniref:glycerate kinase n=1 Tax=Piscicoccus intestinalis TaxID=746033 RepID=UPI000A45B14B|nr:glycerate kinase [Piscicoccus intestinalis]
MPAVVPHRFLIAPSGFKESLDAAEVAEAIACGVRRALPGAVTERIAMVDGGEGTAASLAASTGGRLVPVSVTGPVGQPVESHIALLGGAARGTAVVEMAAAAGLRLVPPDLRDPAATTTYGVGQLIAAALDEGATRILVGCGDSGAPPTEEPVWCGRSAGASSTPVDTPSVTAGRNWPGPPPSTCRG